MERMQPKLREYLTQLREEAYVELKPGVVDTGASGNEMRLTYSAYTPPAPKKKKKFARARFRGKTSVTPVGTPRLPRPKLLPAPRLRPLKHLRAPRRRPRLRPRPVHPSPPPLDSRLATTIRKSRSPASQRRSALDRRLASLCPLRRLPLRPLRITRRV